MEKYKINGKPISLPTGWHDVKFKDALHVRENNFNAVQLFSFFSGIPDEEVERLNHDEDIYYFLQGFPFLYRAPIQDKPSIPRTVKYKNQRLIFPHILFDDPYDFGNTDVGQIEDMKVIIAKMAKEFIGEEERDITDLEMTKIYPYIVAIYIQPILEKEYDHGRAMKLAVELQSEMSYKEVVYMGNFFLVKLGGLTNGLKTGLPRRNWITKKLRQAYKRLISFLDSMLL